MLALTTDFILIESASEIWRSLSFQAGYNASIVTLGVTFLGAASGLLGCFTVLRKRALMSDALAHSALPGLALTFIIVTSLGADARNLIVLLLGAALSASLGIICVQFISRKTRLTEDSAIGAVLSVFFGAGIVLLSYIQNMGTAQAAGLQTFIYGQAAALRLSDMFLTICLTFLAVAVCVLLLKEFRLVCFDPEFAASQGWRVNLIDLIMMGLLILIIVIGLQSVGLILIVALLVIPPATARFWTEDLKVMLVISSVCGALSAYIGTNLSTIIPHLPTGAVIVVSAGCLFVTSLLIAPQRGLIATALRNLALRVKVSEDHILRAAYEIAEQNGDLSGEISLDRVRPLKDWSNYSRKVLLLVARFRNLIRVDFVGRAIFLTPHGLRRAIELVRNHRLWEEYLLHYSGISASHVDFSADFVEHIFDRSIVANLEQALARKGLLPDDQSVPVSRHAAE